MHPYMTSSWKILLVLILPLLTQLQTRTDGVPSEIGSLKLVRSLQGKEAQSFLDRLHEKEVAPKTSLMGQYSLNAYHATLYVSVYETQARAADASRRMTARIKAGNQEFRHYEEIAIRGSVIGRCLGFSQVHFLFPFRGRVFWLAVDPPAATESLDALILSLVGKPGKN